MVLNIICRTCFLACFCLLFSSQQIHVSGNEAPLILTEHIDFIYLRLHHLLHQTPTEIGSLRELLQQELSKSAPYKEAWEEGAQIFQERKSTLVDPEDGDSIPDEYHIALITYTIHDTPKDTPFYAVFNTATRNMCSGVHVNQYPYKSFFQLMRLAIDALNSKPKFAPLESGLYRGVTVRHDFSVGTQLAFQQFSSLSANRTVSEIYSGNITLMVFEKMAKIGIQLNHHSKFPGEAEILVSPLQVFQVTAQNPKSPEGQPYETFILDPITDQKEFKYFSTAGVMQSSFLRMVLFIVVPKIMANYFDY